MAIWGTGPFDNDDARDLIDEAVAKFDLRAIEEAFDGVNGAGGVYLDARDAQRAIAAAEIVAFLLRHPTCRYPLKPEIEAWALCLRQVPPRALADKAQAALTRTLVEPSEVLDLWSEDGAGWREAMSDLQRRFSLWSGLTRHASSVAAAMQCLDDFMTAFNARDLAAWEATFNFPSVRLASDTLVVIDEQGRHPPDTFTRGALAQWHHSAWERRAVIHAGADKVHFDTRFTRYRADGSVIGQFDSVYVVTRENGHWGVKVRSSFAP